MEGTPKGCMSGVKIFTQEIIRDEFNGIKLSR